MGQIKFVGALLMTGLFAIALVTFVTQFGVDNSTNFTLDQDTINTKNQVLNNLTIWKNEINGSSKSFTEGEIQAGETFKTGSQFSGGLFSSMATVKSILSNGYAKIFGSDSTFVVFLNSLFAFLTFIGVVYWYKTWVGRNPD